MSRSTTALAALAVASCYSVVGAVELVHTQQLVFTSPADYIIEWFFVGALVLGALVLARLCHDAARTPITAWGFGTAAVGTATLIVAAGATAIAGRETLDAVFPLGVLLTIIGYLLLAVQDIRHRVEPRRGGLVLAASFIVAMVGAAIGVGTLVLAAGWFALARLVQSTAPDRTPSPV